MEDHLDEIELNDCADGLLEPEDRLRIEAHANACPACRAEIDGLQALRREAWELPREIAPERDLWPSIARRIHPDLQAVPAPRLRTLRPLLAVAAAVFVLLTAFLTTRRPDIPRGHSAGERIESVLLEAADFRAAEAEYETASRQLQAALESRRRNLAPETIAVIEKNLAIIDEALRTSRAALESDPSNGTLSDLVVSTHRKKVEFLQLALNY